MNRDLPSIEQHAERLIKTFDRYLEEKSDRFSFTGTLQKLRALSYDRSQLSVDDRRAVVSALRRLAARAEVWASVLEKPTDVDDASARLKLLLDSIADHASEAKQLAKKLTTISGSPR